MTLIRSDTLVQSGEDYARYSVVGDWTAAQGFRSIAHKNGVTGQHTFDMSALTANRTIIHPDESGTMNLIPSGQRKPFTTRFAARLSNTSTQSLTNGAWTALNGTPFNSEIVDSDSAFSAGVFTCPTGGDGNYHFQTSVEIAGIINAVDMVGAWYKNGALYIRGLRHSAGNTKEHAVVGVGVIPLVATDTVDFRIFHNGGGSVTTRGAAGACSISGWNID